MTFLMTRGNSGKDASLVFVSTFESSVWSRAGNYCSQAEHDQSSCSSSSPGVALELFWADWDGAHVADTCLSQDGTWNQPETDLTGLLTRTRLHAGRYTTGQHKQDCCSPLWACSGSYSWQLRSPSEPALKAVLHTHKKKKIKQP